MFCKTEPKHLARTVLTSFLNQRKILNEMAGKPFPAEIGGGKCECVIQVMAPAFFHFTICTCMNSRSSLLAFDLLHSALEVVQINGAA